MDSDARVEFSLPARAENVALVRHALAGLGEVLGMGPEELADLKTVVTEACTNVVTHAYEPGEEGPLEVSAAPNETVLVVTVRDYGLGIRPVADPEHRSLRLGLPLIAALSDGFEVRADVGGGTAVTMRMPLQASEEAPRVSVKQTGGETRIDIGVGEALAPVLSRVVSMFATRANFTVDRLADAVLLSDAISAAGPDRFPSGRARITVEEMNGSFEIAVGPLGEGGGAQLLDGMRIPQLGTTLAGLAEEVRVEDRDDGEHLLLRFSSTS